MKYNILITEDEREIAELIKLYLENEKMELRLSACMLYCYANLTLGRSVASKRGLQGIQECISKAMKKEISEELQASCVLQKEFRRCGNTVAFFLRG